MRSREVPVEGGPRKERVSLRLGFASAGLSYAIDLGLPPLSDSAFAHDPEIKRECIWAGPVLRPASLLVDRRGPLVRIREGRDWQMLTQDLASFDSMLTQIADPERAPEVLTLREEIRSWRFYDQFRADAEAPPGRPGSARARRSYPMTAAILPRPSRPSARSATVPRSIRRSTIRSQEPNSRSGATAAAWRWSSSTRGSCGLSAPRSCRTVPCEASSGSPPC